MDTNEEILKKLSLYKANNADIYGIESLALVGSASRNEQRENSDIDILIKLKNTTFRGYMAIKEDMEKIFRRKVDLISIHNNMRQLFVKNLTRDAIYV